LRSRLRGSAQPLTAMLDFFFESTTGAQRNDSLRRGR